MKLKWVLIVIAILFILFVVFVKNFDGTSRFEKWTKTGNARPLKAG